MPVLVQIDFSTDGPWGQEMSTAYADLARSIADEPGLLWKIWTESESDGVGGGVYLFDTEDHARPYVDMHTRRLEGFGITGIRALVLDVNEPLTALTRGPLG